jgi:hypothetical protein
MHVFTKDKIARSAQAISNGPAPRVVSHVPNFQIVRRVRLVKGGRVVPSSRVVRRGRAVMAARSGRTSRNVRALRAGVGKIFTGGSKQGRAFEQAAEIFFARVLMLAVGEPEIRRGFIADFEPFEVNNADVGVAAFPDLALLKFHGKRITSHTFDCKRWRW